MVQTQEHWLLVLTAGAQYVLMCARGPMNIQWGGMPNGQLWHWDPCPVCTDWSLQCWAEASETELGLAILSTSWSISSPGQHLLVLLGTDFVFCSPGESRNGDTSEGEGGQLLPDVHDLQGPVHASRQWALPSVSCLQGLWGDPPSSRWKRGTRGWGKSAVEVIGWGWGHWAQCSGAPWSFVTVLQGSINLVVKWCEMWTSGVPNLGLKFKL